MLRERIPQPEPDGESIADVVRVRHTELMRRNPPTMAELDELVQLQRLLSAHIIYVSNEVDHDRH